MTARDNIERRAFAEVRATARTLAGYVATWGAEADLGTFTERVARGAFREALAGDVLALLDHDESRVLGRTRSGTLRLHEDGKGLAFELALPDTQAGRDVLALAERNDLGGMSFGFVVPEGGETWEGRKRTLTKIDLREISVVQAHAAYPNTEIALRRAAAALDREARQRRLIMAELAAWA